MITAKSNSEKYSTYVTTRNAKLIADVTETAIDAFNPHDLLCAGLAACLDITIRMILEHKNIIYDEVIVNVDINTDNDINTQFIYNINIIGDIPAAVKKRVIEIAQKCPVKKTLSRQIEFIMQ